MDRCEPDYMDLDDVRKIAFCKHCDCEVRINIIDEGFDHEFGFHSLPTEVCADCNGRI